MSRSPGDSQSHSSRHSSCSHPRALTCSTVGGGSSASKSSMELRNVCKCGVEFEQNTTWTAENIGRRFWGYGQFAVAGTCMCNYFQWIDEPTYPRGRELLLWDQMSKYRTQVSELKMKLAEAEVDVTQQNDVADRLKIELADCKEMIVKLASELKSGDETTVMLNNGKQGCITMVAWVVVVAVLLGYICDFV